MMGISNQWQCLWYEKIVKATRLGAPPRCGVSPAQGPVETVWHHAYYTDSWSAYTRHLAAEEHELGTRNTQHMERKHLTLRTRCLVRVRKTICFSRSTQMHDLVIGLCVHR